MANTITKKIRSQRVRVVSKMKYLLILLIMFSHTSCSKGSSITRYPPPTDQTQTPPPPPSEKGDSVILITIGSRQYSVSLYNNQTVIAFKAMLPLTLNMSELNNNEKYYNLPQSLPTSASRVTNIRNGDLLLFGSNTLVLFYKSFSTSYSYTSIGRVDNPSGLESDLGRRSVTVTFELIKKE